MKGTSQIFSLICHIFSEVNATLSSLINFLVTYVPQLILHQTIPRLKIKMPDSANSQWHVWVRKKTSPLNMCLMSFRKGGFQVSYTRGIPRRGDDSPLQIILMMWNLVFVIKWEKLFAFIQRYFLRVFHVSFFQLCNIFSNPLLPLFSTSCILKLTFQWFLKKWFDISWEGWKTSQMFQWWDIYQWTEHIGLRTSFIRYSFLYGTT